MWVLVAFIVLAFVFPFTLTFAAAVWEKRMVWPYTPAQPAEAVGGPFVVAAVAPAPIPFQSDAPVPATAHISGTNYSAHQRGFRPVGVMRSAQGKLYRIRFDFWLSPDCLMLVSVSGGTLASIAVANTSFTTRLQDGHRLITIRSPKASETDLTGLNREVLTQDTSFDRQLEKHWQRIATAGVQAVPFNPNDPLGDLHRMAIERIDGLAARGYATFLDPQRTWWKYTVKGALVLTTRMVLRGWRRSFIPDRTRRA
jgi:hypothetical protein